MKFKKGLLTAKEEHDLFTGMTNIMFSELAKRDLVKEFLNNQLDLAQVYTATVNETLIGLLEESIALEKTDRLRSDRIYEINKIIKANAQDIVQAHADSLRGLALKFLDNREENQTDNNPNAASVVKPEDEENPESGTEEERVIETGRDIAFNKNAMEVDVKASMYREIKVILAGIYKTTKTGNMIKNSIGLPEAVDMETMYNRVIKLLSGIPAEYDLMRSRLLLDQHRNPEFIQLVNILDNSNQDIKTKFVQVMYKHNMTYWAAFKETKDKVYLVNANHNKLEDKIKRDWINNLNVILAKRNNGIAEFTEDYIKELRAAQKDANFAKVAAMLGMNISGLNTEIKNKKVRDYIDAIADKVKVGIPTIYTTEKSLNSFRNILFKHAAETSQDTVELQLLNANGKTIHSIGLNSYISNIANKLNYYISNNRLEDFKSLYPEFWNTFNKNSFFLKRIENGATIEVGAATGILVKGADGKVTDELDLASKIIQDFTFVLEGKFPFLRAADRSVENVISINGDGIYLLSQTNEEFIFNMLRYFEDEINSIRYFNINKQNYQYYDKRGGDFRFFDGIVDKERLREFKTITTQEYSTEAEEQAAVKKFIKDNEPYLRDAIFNYLVDATEGVLNTVQEEAVSFPNSLLNEYDDVPHLVRIYTMNSILSSIEITKLFLGDPAFFKNADDFFKRISMFNSTKKGIRTDEEFLRYLNLERPRQDGKIPTDKISSIVYDDISSNTSYEGIKSVFERSFYLDYKEKHTEKKAKELAKKKAEGYAKVYAKVNVADAQGWITLDEAREILVSTGDWTNGQEALYQYEVQKASGIAVPKMYNKYTEEEETITEDMMSPIPVLKLQHTGLASLPKTESRNSRLGVPTGYKFSLFPLMPSIIKGTELEKLNSAMLKNQVGIAMTESANKFGKKNNKDRSKFGEIKNKDIQVIYKQNIGVQLDMGHEFHYSGPRGTQMQKIILSNLDRSKWGKLIDEYNELYNAETKDRLDRVKERFGIAEKDGGYTIGEPDKLMKVLKTTALAKDLSDDMLDAIDYMIANNFYKTDIVFDKTKLDNSLLAVIDRETIKIEKPGFAAVQVSSLGFGKPELKGDDKLKFYRLSEDGKEVLPMQIKLPYYFKDKFFPGQNIKFDDIDPRLLRGIGYRIPTGQKSSIDYFEIVEFLPKSAGNIIIVPEEITAKTGSNFDVDKMQLYLPAYDKQNEYVERSAMQGNIRDRLKAIHNRQMEIMMKVLSDPSEFRNLLVPIGDTLLQEIKEDIYKKLGIQDTVKTFSGAILPTTIWSKFAAFLGGKRAIGHIATQITNHSLAQISDLKIVSSSALEDYFLPANEEGTLSAKLDVNGDLISETLAEFETAYVDIAKDPYIFNLNAGTDNTSVLFYMLRRGTPLKEALYFINQPIIREYSKLARLNSGFSVDRKKAFTDVINDTLKNIGVKANYDSMLVGLIDQHLITPNDIGIEFKMKAYRDKYRKSNLNNKLGGMIGKKVLSPEELELQLQVLDNFLTYKNQATNLLNLVQAYSSDTKGSRGGTNSLRQQITLREEVRKSKFFNTEALDYLDNKSFLAGYNEVQKAALSIDELSIVNKYKDRLAKVFIQYYRAQPNEKTRNTFSNLLTQDLLTYILQTVPNSKFKNDSKLFNNDIATALGMIKSNPRHPLYNSELIKALVVEPAAEGNFIKLINPKMTTLKVDYFKNLFRELYEVEPILAEKLIKLAVNQTGYSKSAYSLNQVIPFELVLQDLLKTISFAESNNIDINNFILEFFENNPKFLKKVKNKQSGKIQYPKGNFNTKFPILVTQDFEGNYTYWVQDKKVSVFGGKEWITYSKSDKLKQRGVYSKWKEYKGNFTLHSDLHKNN